MEKGSGSAREEDKCLKCGRCCYGKIELEGVVYFTGEPCPFLLPSGLCAVYEHRFEACSDCISAARAIELGALPEECPYVRDIPGYRGPRPFRDLVERYGPDVLERITTEEQD